MPRSTSPIVMYFGLALIVSTVSAAVPVLAADKSSLSYTQCSELSSGELLDAIEAASRQRLDHAKNFMFRATTTIQNRRYNEDEGLGQVVWEGMRIDHQLWRLGRSYKLATAQFLGLGDELPTQHVRSGYDEDSGKTLSRINGNGNDKFYARIDTAHDAVLSDCRYLYWLDGPDWPDAEFVVRLVAENCRKGNVELVPAKQQIKIAFKYNSPRLIGVEQAATLWLNPLKGFLPVDGSFRYRRDGNWRKQTFTVKRDRLVGTCWMPIELEEIVEGPVLPKGVVNVWCTRIAEIRQGDVTDADLIIPLPKGTVVVDAIEEVSYSVGPGGERAGPVTPLLRKSP